MTENFLQINVRHQAIIQEAQRIPHRMSGKKTTLGNIIFKLQKSQRQSLKHQRKTHRTYRREQRREVPRVSPQKPCKPEESGMKYLKKKKTTNLEIRTL